MLLVGALVGGSVHANALRLMAVVVAVAGVTIESVRLPVIVLFWVVLGATALGDRRSAVAACPAGPTVRPAEVASRR